MLTRPEVHEAKAEAKSHKAEVVILACLSVH